MWESLKLRPDLKRKFHVAVQRGVRWEVARTQAASDSETLFLRSPFRPFVVDFFEHNRF